MTRTNKLLTLAGVLLLVALLVYGYFYGIAPESNQVLTEDPAKAEMMQSIRQSVGKDAMQARPGPLQNR
jgi:hypothetical protein